MKEKTPTFVKWAGGKRQLIPQFKRFFPEKIDRYLEPFVGGGAITFYVIKNYKPKEVIVSDINEELMNAYNVIKNNPEELIKLLKKYSFGFFPSYDRPIRWVSFSNWEKKIKREEWKFRFFPFTSDTSNLIKEVFDLHLSNEVKHSSDLFCNYIGFNSRDDLLEYVNFYKPLINYFFDDKYQLKTNLTKYIRHNVYPAHNPKEKIFTYILEAISHLYFYKNNKKFFALHYDGFYEIDEKNKKIKKLSKFNLSLNLRLQRFYEWQKVKFHTESSWPFFKNNMKKIGQKFFIN